MLNASLTIALELHYGPRSLSERLFKYSLAVQPQGPLKRTVLYFDYNATSPLHPIARQAWLEISDKHWQNPSSLFPEAAVARVLLEDNRDVLADLLGCEPQRIVFTSGATEANNAIAAFLFQTSHRDATVAISAIEHPCVLDPFHHFFGNRVRELPVNVSGTVCLESIESLLATSNPVLLSVMAANNETGVIQPWENILDLCRQRGISFHTDAAQWIGKLPIQGLGACDWVTGSAHKFGGPKGVGFLVIPENTRSFHSQRGGPQENRSRGGTEDLASITAMVAVLVYLQNQGAPCAQDETGARHRRSLAFGRDAGEARLCELLPGVIPLGQHSERLWNTLAVLVPQVENIRLVAHLGREGIACSTGSACSSSSGTPSAVLTAMGIDSSQARHLIRLSGGWETTPSEWIEAVEKLSIAATQCLAVAPRVALGPQGS